MILEERRSGAGGAPVVRRSVTAPETISGYAAVFNQETIIAGLFRERIAPGAFAEAIRHDDIRAAFNHSAAEILGRTRAGTLQLYEDAFGLHYSVTINQNDPMAVGVAARVARGDVSGSSFAFGILNAADEIWTPAPRGGLPLRTLLRIKLIDVGPVAYPAYGAATATARGRADHMGAARLQVAKARIAIARAR